MTSLSVECTVSVKKVVPQNLSAIFVLNTHDEPMLSKKISGLLHNHITTWKQFWSNCLKDLYELHHFY